MARSASTLGPRKASHRAKGAASPGTGGGAARLGHVYLPVRLRVMARSPGAGDVLGRKER